MSLVRVLASYIGETKFEQLPPEVVEQVKRCLMDCMGNMIGGRYTSKGEKIIRYATDTSNAADATVIGTGRMSREAAAFANACMSRILDLDDGNRFSYGHPGGIIVPAALSIGEYMRASVSDVITAISVGYDIYTRLGTVINPSSYQECGFDATGVCGAVAVAAVAAKLYRLDEEQTKDALGIAGLQAGGIIEYQHDGTMGKILCPAWSVSTGIKAADLAKLGFTGPEEIFEGKKGFFQAFSKKYDASRLTEKLGERYDVLRNYFKIYACMRGLHCALDAILELRSQYSLSPENVKKIIIRTSTFVARLNQSHPQTLVGAQCSLPFTIAVALNFGFVMENVLEKSINSEEITNLENKIEVIVDDKIQDYATKHPDNWTAVEIEVINTGGTSFKHWAEVALGEPEKPLSWEKLEEKFAQLIEPTKFAPETKNIIEAIRHFEEYQNISSFMVKFQQ